MPPEQSDVPMSVTSERPAPGVAVVRPVGDVDTATTGGVRCAIDEEVAAGARSVVLDLSGVAFLGSAGLALLVEQREAALVREGSLHLAAPPRSVTRPLSLTGLEGHFDIHDGVDAAIDSATAATAHG